MKKTTTKTVKTPKAKKTTKASKKQTKKPSFADVLKEALNINMNLVQKESSEANKSLQDTSNDESNSLYIQATPESPDEPEIIIEVELDPDPTLEVEVETRPDPNKMEAEIETLITFKEEHKESPVLEAINRETFDDPEEPNKKENNIKEPLKPIEYKKPVLTYKQRLEAIKARLNRK